ncbi:MAG: hypothetical protein Fur0018_14220 [Anaerolineales bacterium]
MSTSIGTQLRTARERQKLSLQDVSRKIFIRERYLQAMEAGNFAALPSRTQARGFIRLYADFLGLDAPALLAELDAAFAPESEPVSPSLPSTQETPSPEEVPLPARTVSAFLEIGETLQRRRNLLSISLEEVEKHTHIRQRFLEAMENGRFNALSSSIQARGMLHLYSEFLDLNSDDLLTKFADGLRAQLEEKKPEAGLSPAVEKTSAPGWRFWSDWGIIVFIAVLLTAIVVWSVAQVADEGSVAQTAVPTLPEIADVLLVTPTPQETANNTPIPTEPGGANISGSAPETQPTPTPTLNLPGSESGITVNIVIRQRAWLKVGVDGKTVFSGRVLPGSAYPYSANERIEITTGNAGALQIYYQGRDIGALGTSGEAIWRVFTRDGVATPTPQYTNTPTPTLSPTPAPFTPTPTP